MDMKFMQAIKIQYNIEYNLYSYIINFLQKKGEFIMLKFLAKIAEKYAKSTNTACVIFWVGHQPKMPASLIKKD